MFQHAFNIVLFTMCTCIRDLTVNLHMKMDARSKVHLAGSCQVLKAGIWSYIMAQFHGSAYRRILRLQSRFPVIHASTLFFCISLESVECLVTRSTHAQKPKFAPNP